jgi:PAS domain S-box-containing protein
LAALELAKNNQMGKFTGLCPTAKGSPRWWEVVLTPMLDRARNPEKLLSVSRDITERKQAEEGLVRLAAIVGSSDDAIVSKTVAGIITSWNPGAEKMFGYTVQEAIGQSIALIFPPDKLDEQLEILRQIARGESVRHFDTLRVRKDGSQIPVSVTISPVTDAKGKIIGVSKIARDITERKWAETELEKANRQLVEAARQAGMSEVATSVLHNVGNVLNSVNVSCSLISEKVRQSRISSVAKMAELFREHASDLAGFLTTDPSGIKLPEFLGKLAARLAEEQKNVLAEVQLLNGNIEHIKDIINVQQSHARNVGGIRETLPIERLVENALRMVEVSLIRHRIKVTREFDEVPLVSMEKHKVLQILVNLLRNAKHALTDGGGKDKQLILRIGRNNGNVWVSVSDNGIGIPAENMTRIFGHGFSTKKDGHGFGLHSGALAAQEMGGSLTAQSDGPGSGATFTLSFPMVAPDHK